jgi:hypothetical protein
MSHQKTQKKKVIYTVERTFPYIKSRLEICKTEELILSPIEAAIEVERMKAEGQREGCWRGNEEGGF